MLNPRVQKIDSQNVIELATKNPDKAFIIADNFRPGYTPYLQELEYTHYTPDTEKNSLFELLLIRWEDLVWAVAVIPLADLSIAEEVGKTYNFRLAQGCTPVIIGGEESVPFPIKSADNVFSVQGFLKDEQKVAELTQKMIKVINDHQAAIELLDRNGNH